MQTYDSSMAEHFRQKLAQREAEYCAILRASDNVADASAEDRTGEVTDFKDVAEHQSQVALNDAKTENAAHEFEQVLAAQRRLENHRYGLCLRCGEPIDLRRLEALPEAACCTSCQAAYERGSPKP